MLLVRLARCVVPPEASAECRRKRRRVMRRGSVLFRRSWRANHACLVLESITALIVCMLSLTACSNSCENYCDATKDCKPRVVYFGEDCVGECEEYFGDDPDELKCGQESQDLLDCLADSDTPCLDSDECLPVAYARSACFEPDPR